jgi:hypothetical protein
VFTHVLQEVQINVSCMKTKISKNMLNMDSFQVHRFPPPHKRQVINVNNFFSIYVTSIVDLQAMGMYLKVCCDGKKGNLQPILLLECDGTYRNDDC